MKALAFRLSALLLAGAALAACTAQGQSGNLDPKVYFNHTPYSGRFYEALLSDRVNVLSGGGQFRNVVIGVVFGADGTVFQCAAGRVEGKLFWWSNPNIRWGTYRRGDGGRLIWQQVGGERRRTTRFYDPKTGELSVEGWRKKKNAWVVVNRGQIQDTWPRALADACPNLKIPAHIRINEKQTSKKFDELRRQDPDAPIRNFPGSHLTAPGRTGLGASGNRPTTTKAEVEAFLEAQEGNVIVNSRGRDLTYVRVGDREELWRMGNYYRADGYLDVVRTMDEAGEWIEIHEETHDGPKVWRRYPIGYPFPYLPTGHRHPAFQITDAWLAKPHPRSLAFMGEAYADKRFVFHPEGRFSVVDEAGNLVEGPHFDGVWRWTKGHLEMTVRDDRSYSINWRELAVDVDPPPKMWSRYLRDVGGW
ncbi:MAG: hypothetical protein OXE76_09020 [Alphaproteobacteria bacterium]|nr:hypothetical protein [Alphaproteobacteria bacterium]